MSTAADSISAPETRPTPGERIVVGLSGGVDSSVAALLLQQQGYDVHGLFMKNWEDDDTATECTAESDLEDVKQVCEELGIPLHQVNFAREYKQQVFDACLTEFTSGRTPNPDVLCNRKIKFKAFMDYALRLGAGYVATGHYARICTHQGGFRLLKGADANKDQSYFLYTLGQDQLARTLFPLGALRKPAVRGLAEEAGFDNFAKKDSTGICFIGERDFREFLSRYIERCPGEIRTPDGTTVGEHQGLSFYTIGQRGGLGIGGLRGYGTEPWYVAGKDTVDNVLIVVQGHDHPLLMASELEARDLSWVDGLTPEKVVSCTAKTRYRQNDRPCTVAPIGEYRVRVRFNRPQRAVTPGQAVVFYAGDRCLGGGTIDEVRAATGSVRG